VVVATADVVVNAVVVGVVDVEVDGGKVVDVVEVVDVVVDARVVDGAGWTVAVLAPAAVADLSSRGLAAASNATTAAPTTQIINRRLAIRLSILAGNHLKSAAQRHESLQSATMSVVTVDQINQFLAAEFPASKSSCAEVGEGWAVAHLIADALSLRPGGIISGPTVFGLCDAALYHACFTVLGIEPMTVTSEMSIRFLRPARGGEIRARADLVDIGRRSLTGSVMAWTDDIDKPVAVAQGTYVRQRAQ
jgi:uncharacterized protein (TIGR00369 family)